MASLLNERFEKMQDMVRRYLEPVPYVDCDGTEWPNGSDHEKAAFVTDMIYMLDGPEQRAAQAAEHS